MASEPAIVVEELSKSYLIGHERTARRYQTLRESVVHSLAGFARKTTDTLRGRQIVQGDEVEEFWALKDVSFTVDRGEVLAIIGRNGAGKSTLLKVLSRITEPTKGRVKIRGRVASLLEVGTGFHPELTGRENIFLNGAVLGMTRAEIRRKFDEIVAFAEVDKFLDTPVKHYSSGMYVRLAFAVAAHLEPEILVVDEVLAVGDAEFQKKCLGKMSEVAGGGRTVLFVSHNMGLVRALCSKAVLLSRGEIVATGDMVDVAVAYEASAGDRSRTFHRVSGESALRPSLRYAEVAKCGKEPRSTDPAPLSVRMTIHSPIGLDVNVDLRIKDRNGVPVGFATIGSLASKRPLRLQPGYNEAAVTVETAPLAKGEYVLSIDLTIPGVEHLDRIEDCLSFEWEPVVLSGDLKSLDQAWGYGSVRLTALLETPADLLGEVPIE
jgi:lipopolysaccharide transport system ATP-binding protein